MEHYVVDFDPVILDLGFFPVRWYAMAYITGMVGGVYWMLALAARPPALVSGEEIWDLFTWVVVGVIVGGRLGWALFYNYTIFWRDPVQLLKIWEGGMAFHGGLLGVVLAIYLFARNRGIHPFAVSDLVGCAVPIGLFFGRIANFVNGELWGRPTDAAWGMIFPQADRYHGTVDQPRHPSQLYEAVLEGLLIFVLLAWLARFRGALYRPGLCTGLFLTLYGAGRYGVEFLRQRSGDSDAWMPAWMSMGQLLCMLMIVAGLLFIVHALRRPTAEPRQHAAATA